VRVAVVGATGTIGRPLVDVLSVEHDVLAWQGGHPRWRGTGSTGLLLMQPMPSRSIARLTGSTFVYHLVHSLGSREFEELDRGDASNRLSRRARRRSGRSLAAPPQQGRSREDPGGGTSPGHYAARRDDRRSRQHGVRDDPRARREAAADGVPAVGAQAPPRCRRSAARAEAMNG
jgi:hypothetical protein